MRPALKYAHDLRPVPSGMHGHQKLGPVIQQVTGLNR